MDELRFELMNERAYLAYCSWFDHEELRRRISPPTRAWFHYGTETPGVFSWFVYHRDQTLAQLQLDIASSSSGAVGHISVVVNPMLWNQGWCQRILRAFVQRSECATLAAIVAHVEPDNIPSLRCLEAVGFARVGEDAADGTLVYSLSFGESTCRRAAHR